MYIDQILNELKDEVNGGGYRVIRSSEGRIDLKEIAQIINQKNRYVKANVIPLYNGQFNDLEVIDMNAWNERKNNLIDETEYDAFMEAAIITPHHVKTDVPWHVDDKTKLTQSEFDERVRSFKTGLLNIDNLVEEFMTGHKNAEDEDDYQD